MRKIRIAVLITISIASLWPAESDIAARGREFYGKRCSGCHSLNSAKEGPPLGGVFGRRAASDPSFPYSDSLKKAGLVWDEATLERWLADPEALAPDNDMAFRLDHAEERAAIIAYLKQLPARQGHR
ncbi:MAG TPA: c-type cytochrome [Bryobacteraceae bacterium]|jgi:cytochrome c|nr:c-type cytochrome [Bryobacteraceae bacterium]